MSLRRAATAVLLAGTLIPTLASAQATRKYIAFGDSITFGVGDDPARAEKGYTPRLQELLRAAGVTATVVNQGRGGEKTPEGLTRLNNEVLPLGVPGDVLILMEGTNDINQSIDQETTIFNLSSMADNAEDRGLSVIHATVIPRPPFAKVDADNVLTDQLNGRIRNLAGVRGRRLADPNEVFRNLPNVFGGFYSSDPTDRVGHPNAAGYDILARVFFNVIQGIDTVSPVPGPILPLNGARNVKPDATIQVDVWDFGAGIDLANTFLLINGQPVTAIPSGNTRRATLVYQSPTPLSGTVTVGLRSRDLAATPNVIDRTVGRFTVQGAGLMQGDLNQDRRVDGADLILFGLRFGALHGESNFDAAADFNEDGRIDGLDLAVLAGNFGRSSPAT